MAGMRVWDDHNLRDGRKMLRHSWVRVAKVSHVITYAEFASIPASERFALEERDDVIH